MQSDDVSTSTQETHNHQQKILLNLIQAPQEKNFNEEKVGLRTEAKDLAIEVWQFNLMPLLVFYL